MCAYVSLSVCMSDVCVSVCVCIHICVCVCACVRLYVEEEEGISAWSTLMCL